MEARRLRCQEYVTQQNLSAMRCHKPSKANQEDKEHAAEIRRLRSELARVKEERDILKKATAYFARDAD